MIASCWIANVRLLFAFFLFTEAQERPRPVFGARVTVPQARYNRSLDLNSFDAVADSNFAERERWLL